MKLFFSLVIYSAKESSSQQPILNPVTLDGYSYGDFSMENTNNLAHYDRFKKHYLLGAGKHISISRRFKQTLQEIENVLYSNAAIATLYSEPTQTVKVCI